MSVLAAMTWTQSLLTILMLLACLLLIVVILLQKGRGEGLAGALGGGGGGAFGTKTGDMFTWVTVVMAFVVLLLSVVSNYAFDPIRRTATPDAALLPEDTQELPADPEGAAPVDVDIAPVPPPAAEGEAQPSEEPAAADQSAPAEAAEEEAPGTEPPAAPADEQAQPAAGDQPPPGDVPPTEDQPNT